MLVAVALVVYLH